MTTFTTRKHLTTLLASAATAALLLTGCGGPGGGGPTATPSSESRDFPVTVDAAHGKLTLDKKPERIVALSDTSADVLLSLGVTPEAYFAARDDKMLRNSPWLEKIFDRNDPTLVNADWSRSPEAIAAHRPDLIVGDILNVPDKLNGPLSSIAPTYAAEVPSGIRPDWRKVLADFGKLTGTSEQAEQVAVEVDGLVAESRGRLPGLQGKTYNVIDDVDSNKVWFNSGALLNDLGLVPAKNQGTDFSAQAPSLSMERLGDLQADVLVVLDWSGKLRPLLEADPRFAKLPASRNGSVIFLDASAGNAFAVPSPLSLTWLFKESGFVDRLARTPLNSGKA